MKGRISARLERILRDPQARTQLRASLLRGRTGSVKVGDQVYHVTKLATVPVRSNETPPKP